MSNSWTHRLVRPAIRPMIGTSIRPNHLTTLRVLTGVAACALIATATPAEVGWGGGLWVVSALLDRADGELARLGRLGSRLGHMYDYYSDLAINGLFFLCAGIAERHGLLGAWALPMGALGGMCIVLCGVLSERLEQGSPPDTRAYSGRWGFDPDDALYLMAPAAWLGWLLPIVVGTALVTPVVAALTAIRLWRLTRHKLAA